MKQLTKNVFIITRLMSRLCIISVHLVELNGTDQLFAMKAMDKAVMLNRNKVTTVPCVARNLKLCFLLVSAIKVAIDNKNFNRCIELELRERSSICLTILFFLHCTLHFRSENLCAHVYVYACLPVSGHWWIMFFFADQNAYLSYNGLLSRRRTLHAPRSTTKEGP